MDKGNKERSEWRKPCDAYAPPSTSRSFALFTTTASSLHSVSPPHRGVMCVWREQENRRTFTRNWLGVGADRGEREARERSYACLYAVTMAEAEGFAVGSGGIQPTTHAYNRDETL